MKIEGKNAVKELLATGGKIEKLMLIDGSSDSDIRAIFKQAKGLGIQVQWVPKTALEKTSETGHHQGVIAIAGDYEYADLDEVLLKAKSTGREMFFIVLDEILDPHNLGSIIRTAECAGLTGVIIPTRRSALVNETAIRTSAGATAYIPVIKVQNINSAIETLKKENVWVYALDMDGEPMGKTNLTGNIALVVGNEGDGVHALTRKICDGVISIPMYGNLNSLNASVSAGISIYEAVRQRSK